MSGRRPAACRIGAAIVAAAALFAGGCASLSKDECRNADWQAIGQRDGAAGETPDRLAAHAKACAEVGVVPDEARWLQGREIGLASYCTGRRGREVGARGFFYRDVCTGPSELEFRRGYEIGRQIEQLNQLLAGNQGDRRRLLDRLAQKGVSDEERQQIRLRLIRLDQDADRLRWSIDSAWRIPL